MPDEMKQGIYETEYGNAAEYTGGDMAWDIDMAEEIPVEFLMKFIRDFD